MTENSSLFEPEISKQHKIQKIHESNTLEIENLGKDHEKGKEKFMKNVLDEGIKFNQIVDELAIEIIEKQEEMRQKLRQY